MLLLFALYVGGLGLYYTRLSPELIHVPRWIFYLLAVLLGYGSGLAFLGQKHPLTNLLAAVIWILFAVIGIWASLFSSLDNLSGGLAMLSPRANRMIARLLFGLGAILNIGAGIYAGRRWVKEQAVLNTDDQD